MQQVSKLIQRILINSPSTSMLLTKSQGDKFLDMVNLEDDGIDEGSWVSEEKMTENVK